MDKELEHGFRFLNQCLDRKIEYTIDYYLPGEYFREKGYSFLHSKSENIDERKAILKFFNSSKELKRISEKDCLIST